MEIIEKPSIKYIKLDKTKKPFYRRGWQKCFTQKSLQTGSASSRNDFRPIDEYEQCLKHGRVELFQYAFSFSLLTIIDIDGKAQSFR